jgi:hypothetical protein
VDALVEAGQLLEKKRPKLVAVASPISRMSVSCARARDAWAVWLLSSSSSRAMERWR